MIKSPYFLAIQTLAPYTILCGHHHPLEILNCVLMTTSKLLRFHSSIIAQNTLLSKVLNFYVSFYILFEELVVIHEIFRSSLNLLLVKSKFYNVCGALMSVEHSVCNTHVCGALVFVKHSCLWDTHV